MRGVAFGNLYRSMCCYGRPLHINLLDRRTRLTARSLGQHKNIAYYHVASKPRILLSSDQLLIDEKVHIKTDGLRPGQKITLFATVTEGDKQYGSCGHYVAKDEGVVDMLEDASLGGTFTGVESMGLFWSMKSKPGVKDRRLNKQDVMSPYKVSIEVLEGFFNFEDLPWEGSEDVLLVSTKLQRTYSKPGVKRVVVEEDGLYGTLFFPPGDGPFPAVIDMFGFTNECIEFRSALLASHGIASFLLNYIGHKELPSDYRDLDQHYFLKAFDFLAAHPDVNENELGGIATCGGAAFLLLIAFKRPTMKCCVSVNGTLISMGKTQEVEGEMINTVDINFKNALVVDGGVVTRTLYNPGQEKMVLPAWRHGAKMLLIQGLADQCGSPECFHAVLPLIPDSFSSSIQVLTYPGAGHLLEPPFTPHVHANYNPLLKTQLIFGGEPVLHTRAQEDSWPKILDFLHENLKSS